MSLQPYSEYKDSGIDWLGHVPRHWKITRLKNSISEAKNGVWGLEPDGSELDLRCVRVADFDRPRLSIHDRNATLRKIPFSEQTGRILEKGDLLLEKSGGGEKSPVGFVVLYDRDEPAVCSNFVARLVLRPGMDSQFWTYLHSMLYSRRLTQRSIKQTTGIQNLDQASYFDELVAFPTDTEQRDIAEFLDRETAEIDAFIADQERLIGLLEERRVATITHAVTKGLDSTAHMKDTDVEWLGRVPEHWEMSSLRHLLKSPLKYGANEPATSADPEQVRYLRITDFDQRGQLRDETFRSLPEEIARNYMVLPHDVLLARSGATVGKAFIVPEDSPPACFAGYLIRVDVSREKILPEYFFLYTQTASFEAWKNLVMIQATIQNISAEKYASLKVPLPPLDEQRHIVRGLSIEISKIDTAIADAQEAIVLSRERRAALISAAVTGQIDVSQAQTRGSTGEVLEQGVRV